MTAHSSYTEYKDSGVEWLGEIPAHWEVRALGSRYRVDLGKMLDAKKITGESLTPYLRNRDVQWYGINSADLPQMDIADYERARYTVEKGDLLVCEGGDVGRCAIWEKDFEVGFQKALHRVRPKDGNADLVPFLRCALEVAADDGVFTRNGNESTIMHLPAADFVRYRFAFPPLDEQYTIVDHIQTVTSRADAMIAAMQSSIALAQEYFQTLISDMVTGRT